MNITTLGIDIAKQVFQLHGTDGQGKVTLRKRLRRSQLLTFMQQLPPCLVGMEACAGAHYWAKKFQSYGHTVKLIAPQYVKPYVKTNKNDYNDAEAINEAVTRPNMRFVGIKADWQQDIQALHRVRSRLMQSRTTLVNKHRHPVIRKMKQHEYDGSTVLLIKNSVFSQIQSERQSIAVSS